MAKKHHTVVLPANSEIDVEKIVNEKVAEALADFFVRANDRYMTEQEVAQRLGLEPKALQNWRQVGGGPKFRKFGGAVRYALSDLLAYEDAATRTSTSQPA